MESDAECWYRTSDIRNVSDLLVRLDFTQMIWLDGGCDYCLRENLTMKLLCEYGIRFSRVIPL